MKKLIFTGLITLGSALTSQALTVSPFTDTKLDQPESVVYSPTFGIVWQEVGKFLVIPETPNIFQRLNKSALEVDRNALPEDCYTVIAGLKADVYQKILQSHEKMFGKKLTLQTLPEDVNLKQFYAYAALKRDLPFQKPFPGDHTIGFKVEGKYKVVGAWGFAYDSSDNAEAWGDPSSGETAIDYKSLRDQIDVISYTDDNQFTVRLKTAVKNEWIVLSKMPAPATLGDAISTTGTQLKNWNKLTASEPKGTSPGLPAPLKEDEPFLVPRVKFQAENRFTEIPPKLSLESKSQEDHTTYRIADALQSVTFTLNRTGAEVADFSYCIVFEESIDEPTELRAFIFDQPFLACLWKEGASQPYLAVWVNSSDVLDIIEEGEEATANSTEPSDSDKWYDDEWE